MKSYQQILEDYFEVEGWENIDTYDIDHEWWSDEIWKLKSKWSPKGANAYLTLLIDPQCNHNKRKKGQEVWAAGISLNEPKTKEEAESNGVIIFDSSFKRDIEVFLEKLDALRYL